MPRMLSLWLDFGAKAYECDKGKTFNVVFPVSCFYIYDQKSSKVYFCWASYQKIASFIHTGSLMTASFTSAIDVVSQNVNSS